MARGVGSQWRYDEAQLQKRLWTPDLLRPDLSLWLDAADLSTITVQTGVSQWRDKSVNQNHANQSNIANQPQFLSSGLQEKPSIRFLPDTSSSSTGDRLTIAHASNLTPVAYIIAAVIDNDGALNTGPAGYRAFIEKASSSAGGTGRKYWIGMNPTNTLYVNTEEANIFISSAGSVIETAQIVLLVKPATQSIGSAIFRQNGRQVASDASFGGVSPNSASLDIGGSFYPWNGLISEVILWANSNSLTIELIEGYLAHKWGIRLASSHPFANRPPLIGD